ncbi:MAG: S41 family peptidase [Bacteroidia bacterium]|nr:S41 family peptidase [Bacteroidia bacterium]
MMKTVKIGRLMLWSIIVLATLSQCRKEAVVPTPVDPVVQEVKNFVWSGMHDYYLWNLQVPNLTNTNYQMLTTSSANYQRNKDSLNAYLDKFTDPTKLFNDLLYQYKVVDKWSFIEKDYTIIDNWIAGISKTMGYDFQLYYLNSTSTDIIGVVRYVLKGSPADLAGVQRGDIFAKVDGVQLTDANYTANLINKESFTLTFAKVVSGIITPTGKTASMTAVQLQEDPVFLSKVIDVNGSKVGYLVYNGFTSDFDLELNSAFQQFKTAGVSMLILDLRYNGGGSVQTAIYLASMIYTTNTATLFTKSVYNGILTPYITTTYGASYFNSNFTDKINTTAINALNLKDIYFIVSGETASASELLINGLKPYMNVKSIGTNTYGKYVASLTLKDYDANNNLVTTHKYAMQPIVAKYANSLGVSDFVTGLTPDITLKEDIGNMLQLGDENETLLKAALDNIKGLKSLSLTPPSSLANSRSLIARKDLVQFSRDMYVDPQKLVKRNR